MAGGLAAAAVLAACGDSTASPRATPSISPSPTRTTHACDLVPRDQAQATAGVIFDHAPLDQRRINGAECRYGADKASLTVDLDDRNGIDDGRKAYSDSQAQPVVDLGDEALWNPPLRVVWARRLDYAVTIQLVNPALSEETIRARAIDLARAVIAKL